MTRSHLGRRVSDHDPFGALVVIVCAVSASLAVAWLLHLAVERPAMRWASRIRWTTER
jgi:peptidoglycan/LPS O-acetylase OafA/YrhL